MKMKKLFTVISMLTVMCMLAGCSSDTKKPFEYNDSELVSTVENLFTSYVDVEGNLADYYIENGTKVESSLVDGIIQAKETDEVGTFGSFDEDYDIVYDDSSVSVTVVNHASNRDVEVTVKFEENSEYVMNFELVKADVEAQLQTIVQQNGVTTSEVLAQYGCTTLDELVIYVMQSNGLTTEKYNAIEAEVSAIYSTKELMGQAGSNTIIGMGTVFIVLIFISFIISLFKFLPALFSKKPAVPEKKQANTVVSTAPAVVENLMDDSELVAVITAAIYAMSSENGTGSISKDTLVVRSIKKTRR